MRSIFTIAQELADTDQHLAEYGKLQAELLQAAAVYDIPSAAFRLWEAVKGWSDNSFDEEYRERVELLLHEVESSVANANRMKIRLTNATDRNIIACVQYGLENNAPIVPQTNLPRYLDWLSGKVCGRLLNKCNYRADPEDMRCGTYFQTGEWECSTCGAPRKICASVQVTKSGRCRFHRSRHVPKDIISFHGMNEELAVRGPFKNEQLDHLYREAIVDPDLLTLKRGVAVSQTMLNMATLEYGEVSMQDLMIALSSISALAHDVLARWTEAEEDDEPLDEETLLNALSQVASAASNLLTQATETERAREKVNEQLDLHRRLVESNMKILKAQENVMTVDQGWKLVEDFRKSMIGALRHYGYDVDVVAEIEARTRQLFDSVTFGERVKSNLISSMRGKSATSVRQKPKVIDG